MHRLVLAWFTLTLVAGSICANAQAHPRELWGFHPIEWQVGEISEILSGVEDGRNIYINGQNCLAARALHFNVRDQFAFDIDETVSIDLTFYVGSAAGRIRLVYDRSDVAPATLMGGDASASRELELAGAPTSRLYKQRITLERARFANLGYGGTDFSIRSVGNGSVAETFTLCKLALRRDHRNPVPAASGQVTIEVIDEQGEPTPARMGIYDGTGRMPLPSDQAVSLRDLTEKTRVLALRLHASAWPHKNRSVFYVDGSYGARLPAGTYELIVAKGPEYRMVREEFSVLEGQSRHITVRLHRWRDMVRQGWYSGEGHIHYSRQNGVDDRELQLFTRAEDLRVANVLQMGNVANIYFRQHDWSSLVSSHEPWFAIIPGQEEPRTSQRGHVLLLNVRENVHNQERYLLYHEIFQKVHAGGGVIGYAHVNEEQDRFLNAVRGLALDVPFGLVDFAEVLSLHFADTSIWFDFLNLGYKLTPAAGTDYPWGDVPGAVRNYVKVPAGKFTPQVWLDEFKKGHTFVTSGPMLDIDINGQGMGSEIHLNSGEPIRVTARAAINSDVDTLSQLELLEQGQPAKIVKTGADASKIELQYESTASHGTWFVLVARGKRSNVIAFSAPIYVVVDGQSFWKPAAVPSIVAKLKGRMHELLGPWRAELLEAWETQRMDAEYWKPQQSALRERISQAASIYDELERRALAGEAASSDEGMTSPVTQKQ